MFMSLASMRSGCWTNKKSSAYWTILISSVISVLLEYNNNGGDFTFYGGNILVSREGYIQAIIISDLIDSNDDEE